MDLLEWNIRKLRFFSWIVWSVRSIVFCVSLISFEHVFEKGVLFPEIGTNFHFFMAGQFEDWFRFVRSWLL